MIDDDSRGREDAAPFFWTVQQFATVCRQPWFALHRQNDDGVQWGFTGYRHEIDALVKKLGIAPQELPPIEEEEYYRRMAGEMPEEPGAPVMHRPLLQPKQ